MSVELHLPDLPEVPLSLGLPPASPGPRAPTPWLLRLRDALASYLPLLLMALLAMATWWLVKNAPRPPAPSEAKTPSSEPDVVMNRFALERFDAQGRLKLRIEGARLRHFPDTDRVEIDASHIQAFAPDGRVTRATAARAWGAGDGSEFELQGGAEVLSTDDSGAPVRMRSEFLHTFVQLQQVQSHLPVTVLSNGAELRAGGLAYDHNRGLLDLKGPVKSVLQPLARAEKGAAGTAPALAPASAAATNLPTRPAGGAP